MKIEHIALWTQDLEQSRTFYETYFGATSNAKYINEAKQFESYFLTFDSGTRLEIMQRADVIANNPVETIGLAHFAISMGSKSSVDEMTNRLRNDGYTVASEPRTTGDGYYESVILDPDGNHIELTT